MSLPGTGWAAGRISARTTNRSVNAVNTLAADVTRTINYPPGDMDTAESNVASFLSPPAPPPAGAKNSPVAAPQLVSDPSKVAWATDALTATRARANGWGAGAGGTLGVILGSLAINPGEGLMKYGGYARVGLMLLVAVSVGCAIRSLYLFLRAAHGPTWLLELPADAPVSRWLARLAGARKDLMSGRAWWLTSVLVFSFAILVSWIATPN